MPKEHSEPGSTQIKMVGIDLIAFVLFMLTNYIDKMYKKNRQFILL